MKKRKKTRGAEREGERGRESTPEKEYTGERGKRGKCVMLHWHWDNIYNVITLTRNCPTLIGLESQMHCSIIMSLFCSRIGFHHHIFYIKRVIKGLIYDYDNNDYALVVRVAFWRLISIAGSRLARTSDLYWWITCRKLNSVMLIC